MKIKVSSSQKAYQVVSCSRDQLFSDWIEGDFLITDENLASHYPELIADKHKAIVPAGESSKCLSIYGRCLSEMVQAGCRRSSKVYAFGGGVVGDLAGFVAATYMRGVELIQLPTSLLSMVDSSVGGKVAIDLPEGKNLVGAFWPAQEVRIDPEVLKTLPERQWRNGFAEMIKYGAIYDRELFQRLTDAEQSRKNILPLIERCLEIKRDIVQEDEFETTGLRAILNFGHTFGHAIERVQNYQELEHGEAVAVGMVHEAKLTESLQLTEPGTSDLLRSVCERYGLNTAWPSNVSSSETMKALFADKKKVGEGIAMSVVGCISECKLHTNLPAEKVENYLKDL